MSIKLSLDKHELDDSSKRVRRAKVSTIIVTGAIILMCLGLIHHDVTNGWVVDVKSFIAGFQGPYTPVEKVTLGSAGFSLLASVSLEGILFYAMREGESKTKRWIRTTIFLILAVNIALALSSFVFTLFDNTELIDLEFMASAGSDVWDKEYRTNDGPSTWSCELRAYKNLRNNAFAVGRTCKSRLASRWLSLLIFIFSVILVALAWMDFKDEEVWLLPSTPLDEEAKIESQNEKDIVLFVEE
ncbi:hypothetical protein F5X96DRAFT_664596 [Biscogniauxia mediterranea]|nr:hypothetical protein F5X96DRAFT_664596 [Biscogniauxia mediterranea]